MMFQARKCLKSYIKRCCCQVWPDVLPGMTRYCINGLKVILQGLQVDGLRQLEDLPGGADLAQEAQPRVRHREARVHRQALHHQRHHQQGLRNRSFKSEWQEQQFGALLGCIKSRHCISVRFVGVASCLFSAQILAWKWGTRSVKFFCKPAMRQTVALVTLT